MQYTFIMINPTERFTNRVKNYVRYRPSYPPQIIQYLTEQCHLGSNSTIADVGSGTGLLTELFLKSDYQVFGIEPNHEMRLAGEALLSEFSKFKSINGTAESTTLEHKSIDLIVAGQAFHWFDQDKTKIEFQRILKSDGWVGLIWNTRRDDSPFLKDYTKLLIEYGTDYVQVHHQQESRESEFKQFFLADEYILNTFPNQQTFDYDGLRGRLLSCSYVPNEDHPNYNKMLTYLRHIFNTHEVNGKINIDYDTEIFLGRV